MDTDSPQATPLRVLILEDRPADAELMLHELRRAGYDPTWQRVETEPDFLAHLDPDLDLILSDFDLPQFDGLSALALFKARGLDIPFILVSGAIGEDSAVAAMRSGAADYLLKDRLARLGPAVAQALMQTQLRAEKRRAEAQTAHSHRLLKALSLASQAVHRARTAAEVYQSAGDELTRLDWTSAVLVWSHDREHLLISHTNVRPDLLRAAEKLTGLSIQDFRMPLAPGSFFARALTAAEATFSQSFVENYPDILPDPVRPLAGELAALFGGDATIAVPLLVFGKTHGLLTVSGAELTEIDLPAVSTFANQVSIALENVQLLRQTQRQVEELATVSTIALAGASGQSFDSIVALATASLTQLWPDEPLGFLFPDEVGQSLVPHASYHGLPGEALAALHIPLDSGMTGWAAPVPQPVHVEDASRVARHIAGVSELRSEMAAPLAVDGHLIGVVEVRSHRPAAFADDDLRLLETLAGQLATVFERVRLQADLTEHAVGLERRVAERTAELQTQYARLEAILDSTSDGILVTDARGSILRANPVARRWLSEILPPDDAEKFREAVAGLAAGAAARPKTVLELTGLDLEMSAGLVLGDGAEESTAVVAVHDVSRLKSLERIRSAFVTNVSHELRTPIATVKLAVSLMRRKPKEEWDRYFTLLETEAERQGRLVNGILEIFRLDAGRTTLKLEYLDLNLVAQAAFAQRQILAQAGGLTMTLAPVEPGPVVRVDPERLVQVVNNLVENAIHYTPAGGRIVLSTALTTAEGQPWATIAVADTGIGIPQDELALVFERFFRGDRPRAMQTPGSGLGLSIVREIAELQGGRVTIESEVDAGTTVTIWLPLA